jgi:flagellar biosynthesis protein FlhB
MEPLPLESMIKILIILVTLFIIFWIDEKRLKNELPFLDKYFKKFPEYTKNQKEGFFLVVIAAVGSIFSIYLYISSIFLFVGLYKLWKDRI